MANIGTYLRAARPFSFTASITAALFGNVAAYYHFFNDLRFEFNVISCVLSTVGCVCIHIVSNFVNTYHDEKSGLDRVPEAAGADNAIVKEILTAAEVKRASYIVFFCAFAIGLYFIVLCGLPIAALVAFGAVSAWAYTAPPFRLKYRGLGDIQVLLSFGVLMIVGAYTTQAYSVATFIDYGRIVMMSLPLSFLVDAILHANNHRDREVDILYGAKTLATRISVSASEHFFRFLVYAPFGLMLIYAYFGIMPLWSLLCMVSFIPAYTTVTKLIRRSDYPADIYNLITADTAKIHLFFGILSLLGLLISTL